MNRTASLIPTLLPGGEGLENPSPPGRGNGAREGFSFLYSSDMAQSILSPARQRGISLIELIVVIVLSGIIAGVLGMFIVRPIRGYDDQVRRATLVDAAEGALRRMQRDVRQALPNSIRLRELATTAVCSATSTGCALELLHTADGGRYRENADSICAGANLLDFSAADTSFDMTGSLQNSAVGNFPGGTRVVIYNLGQTGGNAYAGADVITPSGTVSLSQPNAGNANPSCRNDRITFPAFQFRFRSPTQRFFIVDTPVTYLCNTTTGTLTRYSSYSITAAQPTSAGAAPLNAAASAVLVDRVSRCNITYATGTDTRAGLATLDLTVTIAGSNESVRLLHQVHVDNAP